MIVPLNQSLDTPQWLQPAPETPRKPCRDPAQRTQTTTRRSVSLQDSHGTELFLAKGSPSRDSNRTGRAVGCGKGTRLSRESPTHGRSASSKVDALAAVSPQRRSVSCGVTLHVRSHSVEPQLRRSCGGDRAQMGILRRVAATTTSPGRKRNMEGGDKRLWQGQTSPDETLKPKQMPDYL